MKLERVRASCGEGHIGHASPPNLILYTIGNHIQIFRQKNKKIGILVLEWKVDQKMNKTEGERLFRRLS